MTAVTTWTTWSPDPALLWVATVAVLYWIGGRQASQRRTPWQTAMFAAGLAVLVVALASPIHGFAEELLWVHMIQHVLLILVAPPLLALARPWNRIWHGLPLELRRDIAGTVMRGGPRAPLRRAARVIGSPVISLLIFNVTLLAWHLPFAYDATLHSSVAHAAEHLTFFATGLLFWTRVIDSPPFHSPLTAPARAVYAGVALVVSWGLAVALAMAPDAIYSGYADLGTRPGGISAIADQRIAAGVMWVPGSIPLTIVILAVVSRWLGLDRADTEHAPAAGAGS